jgi:hypothetical protein
MLQSPVAEKTGTVTFTISGGERTALPAIDQFEKITLSFAPRDGSPAVTDQDAKGGSVAVSLPLGSWDVTANAYINEIDPTPAATAQKTVSYDGTAIGEIRFILAPAGTGKGILKYSVVVPGTVTLAGSGSQITIEQNGAALEDLDDDGFTDGARAISGDETDGISVSLNEGRYVARIVLADNTEPDANTAVFLESVVILPGLITEISFGPDAADFLSPAERAALSELGSLAFSGTSFNTGITVGSLEVSGQDHTLAIEAEADTETLYFTFTKPAAYTAGLGADAAGIAVFDTFEEGPIPSDELVVIKVNTSSVAEGGDVAFTLIMGEPGKTAVEIAVKVTVAVAGGPGLYIATEAVGQEVLTKVKDGNITDLKTALIWLETNAADDTDYVVLIGEDSELSDAYQYTSKTGSSDVTITLRGMDAERKIYWDPNANGGGSSKGVFNIVPGTTLALGDKVTFDGNSAGRGLRHANVAVLTGGSFEMLPGSKITGLEEAVPIVSGAATGHPLSTIILRGGTITNNTVIGGVVSSSQNVKTRLEMYDGAVITQNTIRIPGTPNAAGIAQYVLGPIGAVSLTSWGGTFIMHGGEISYNSVRGVAIAVDTNGGGTSGSAVFDMRGGTIHHNGNDVIPMVNPSGENYALAAGVFFSDLGGSFTMTGGEISDNGSANSTLPYSGIYLNCRTPTGTTQYNTVLNGTIAIKNNNVTAFANFNSQGKFYLGGNFVTADPIELVLITPLVNPDNLATYWNGKQLLASLPQDGLTIDTAAVSKFSLAGNYYMHYWIGVSSPGGCQELTNYTSAISDGTEEGPGAGYVVVTAK